MSQDLHQFFATSFSEINVFPTLGEEHKQVIIEELVAYVTKIRKALEPSSRLIHSGVGLGALYDQAVGAGLLSTDASLADLAAIIEESPQFRCEVNPEATEIKKKVRVFLLDPEQ